MNLNDCENIGKSSFSLQNYQRLLAFHGLKCQILLRSHSWPVTVPPEWVRQNITVFELSIWDTYRLSHIQRYCLFSWQRCAAHVCVAFKVFVWRILTTKHMWDKQQDHFSFFSTFTGSQMSEYNQKAKSRHNFSSQSNVITGTSGTLTIWEKWHVPVNFCPFKDVLGDRDADENFSQAFPITDFVTHFQTHLGCRLCDANMHFSESGAKPKHYWDHLT